MQVTLNVLAGPHQGKEFQFDGHDMFLVGRSKQAHFRLADRDQYFSRIHFLVETNPPRCRLVDMGSRNGTFVNGQRVEQTDLKEGDVIKAGHTVMAVTLSKESSLEGTQSWSHAKEKVPGSDTPVRVAGYRIVRELGRGGMGMVFEAVRETDGQSVALKCIIPALAGHPRQVARFLREAAILRELDHPSIVRFQDLGEADGRIFFAMDFVPGTDAGKLVATRGPLPLPVALRLLDQVLDGLAYAHGQRFVHRDIKPSNLLLQPVPGQGWTVKLADFGLARVYQASQLSGLTLSGDVGGTFTFMPPEQVTNFREVKPAADQYSAAATLYYLLTGKGLHDYEASPLHPLALLLQESPIPLRQRQPALGEELAAVVHRALAREPEARFPDVTAFRQALAACGK